MSDFFNSSIKVANIFINIVFLAHWMACIFYLFGREENSAQSWIVKCEIQDLPLFDQYVTSLYWAITTMITVLNWIHLLGRLR
jgi:hypothetical protein